MADVAILLHWPPAAMDGMPVSELMHWRQLAVSRHNHLNTPPSR
ncbi:tail protein [Acidovorax phage Acica]|nr:tail protein [Acidovorax phage Acica]